MKSNLSGRFDNSERAPATIDDEGLADAAAANAFRLPDFTQELVRRRRPDAFLDAAAGEPQ